MGELNTVAVIGRITRDLDGNSFGYTKNGIAKASVPIAWNEKRKSGEEWIEEVSYFEVVIWGKMAENLKPYLTKGKQIGVIGKMKQDRWEKDGVKHSKVYIVANDVQLLGGNSGNNSNVVNAKNENNYAPATDSFDDQSFPEDVPF